MSIETAQIEGLTVHYLAVPVVAPCWTIKNNTLYAALFAKARTLLTLDRRSFHPPPKVRSAVIVLDADRKPYASSDMIELLSVSFRMRRKKLVNNLIGFRDLVREDALEAMRRAGIGEGARAEELSLDDFARLHAELRR